MASRLARSSLVGPSRSNATEVSDPAEHGCVNERSQPVEAITAPPTGPLHVAIQAPTRPGKGGHPRPR